VGQPGVATDHERPEMEYVRITETGAEVARMLHVVELPEPIDHLAEASFHPTRPLRSRLPPLRAEEAVRGRVFPFDESEDLPHRVAHDQVAAKIAEELILESHKVHVSEAPAIRAQQRRELEVALEKRFDVGPFLQFCLSVKQGPEFGQFLTAERKVELDSRELLHLGSGPVLRREVAVDGFLHHQVEQEDSRPFRPEENEQVIGADLRVQSVDLFRRSLGRVDNQPTSRGRGRTYVESLSQTHAALTPYARYGCYDECPHDLGLDGAGRPIGRRTTGQRIERLADLLLCRGGQMMPTDQCAIVEDDVLRAGEQFPCSGFSPLFG
jgi:hypothetical protein